MLPKRTRFWSVAIGCLLLVPAVSSGQTPSDLNLAQPDFTVINFPSTLRLPQYKGAFRVTHRFGRPIGDGNFGDLAGDLFGIDSGAQVGLEFRFGIRPGLQVGVYRTNDKTIELFGQYDAIRQSETMPVTVDIFAGVDGRNNFGLCCDETPQPHEFSPVIGVIFSRTISDRAALYFQPTWVAHSNVFSADTSTEDHTAMIGLSGRVRIRPTVYLVGLWGPRIAGFMGGVSLKSFGIEKRLGGHSFQVNVSNGLGSTMGQIARGAGSNEDWYFGFNISRKFF